MSVFGYQPTYTPTYAPQPQPAMARPGVPGGGAGGFAPSASPLAPGQEQVAGSPNPFFVDFSPTPGAAPDTPTYQGSRQRQASPNLATGDIFETPTRRGAFNNPLAELEGMTRGSQNVPSGLQGPGLGISGMRGSGSDGIVTARDFNQMVSGLSQDQLRQINLPQMQQYFQGAAQSLTNYYQNPDFQRRSERSFGVNAQSELDYLQQAYESILGQANANYML